MSTQRKVVLYIAISVDGYIAKEDGNIDWLHEAESQGIADIQNFTKLLIQC